MTHVSGLSEDERVVGFSNFHPMVRRGGPPLRER